MKETIDVNVSFLKSLSIYTVFILYGGEKHVVALHCMAFIFEVDTREVNTYKVWYFDVHN